MPRVMQLESTRSPKLTLKIQLSTAAHSLSRTDLCSCNLKRSVKSGASQRTKLTIQVTFPRSHSMSVEKPFCVLAL